jgi:hypothetical protein
MGTGTALVVTPVTKNEMLVPMILMIVPVIVLFASYVTVMV